MRRFESLGYRNDPQLEQGPRHEGEYAAFIRDHDNNRIEAMTSTA